MAEDEQEDKNKRKDRESNLAVKNYIQNQNSLRLHADLRMQVAFQLNGWLIR